MKSLYNLNNSMLANSKPNLRVLHPLPRITEISQDVDDNPRLITSSRPRTACMPVRP